MGQLGMVIYTPRVQFHLQTRTKWASELTEIWHSRQKILILFYPNTLPTELTPVIIRSTGNISNMSYSLVTGIGVGESLHLSPGSAPEELTDCMEIQPISFCVH